ncbi:hypothetical protein BU17DRAFT_86101 [Hysterangium stoloniferum]|nr:hypothetical protein BU17DRAFT_86101 [Hysterangium stoloniferum]
MVHNNDASALNDSPLPSTVDNITADSPHIRILVLGKTGCGKSSLINKVFGVDQTEVSHDGPGQANIHTAFRHSSNTRFILHDSQGFEPGDDTKLNIVKHFIEKLTEEEVPDKDKLHVIWICISVPRAGDRVIETGVQEVFSLAQKRKLPAIIIFTKFDMLVTIAMSEEKDAVASLSKKEMWRHIEDKAKEAFESLCVRPWRDVVGRVPLMVSTRQKYQNTIQAVIQATDEEIQQRTSNFSHTEPHSLNFTAAQRLNTDMKIDASIDIGRFKYWSGLLSKTDFSGKQLKQCLDVIHRDIVAVWNIRNSNFLASDKFKAKMIVLVDDLVSNPNTPIIGQELTLATVAALAGAATTAAGIAIIAAGVVLRLLKWIYDVYDNTAGSVACVMGYIADLTIVMHRLSSAGDVSEQTVESILVDYAKSSQISQVHNDIRKFIKDSFPFPFQDNDYIINEIIRLIEQHRVQVPLAQ